MDGAGTKFLCSGNHGMNNPGSESCPPFRRYPRSKKRNISYEGRRASSLWCLRPAVLLRTGLYPTSLFTRTSPHELIKQRLRLRHPLSVYQKTRSFWEGPAKRFAGKRNGSGRADDDWNHHLLTFLQVVEAYVQAAATDPAATAKMAQPPINALELREHLMHSLSERQKRGEKRPPPTDTPEVQPEAVVEISDEDQTGGAETSQESREQLPDTKRQRSTTLDDAAINLSNDFSTYVHYIMEKNEVRNEKVETALKELRDNMALRDKKLQEQMNDISRKLDMIADAVRK